MKPIVTVSITADQQVKVQIDTAPMAGTNPQWFGELLGGLANGYADTLLHMGNLPGVSREQILADVIGGFTNIMLVPPAQ